MRLWTLVSLFVSGLAFAAASETVTLEPGSTVTVKPAVETVVACKTTPVAQLGYDALLYHGTSYYKVVGNCKVERYSTIPLSEVSTRVKVLRTFECEGEKYAYFAVGRNDYIVRAADIWLIPNN